MTLIEQIIQDEHIDENFKGFLKLRESEERYWEAENKEKKS